VPKEEPSQERMLGELVAPGRLVVDKYRIERVIGTGGMGVVVEAWHLGFDERVAIKFLLPQAGTDDEALARFEREARTAFKIKSEHVCRVIDVGKLEAKTTTSTERVPFMVMEYLEGRDLGEMLTARKGLAIADAVDWILQACEAVAEAHVLGIVHRDLKPENLFLTQRADGTPCIKVLDFGLSKVQAVAGAPRERALTAIKQVMGTPQYMSPEQWMSAAEVGPPSDIWALGVILFELVTGVQPFDKEQVAQLCHQVLHSEPEPLSKLRPDAATGLEQVILRCLRKNPADRWANVAELAVALHTYGPARSRASVRRVAGVFKRVGVDTGDVPVSQRTGAGGLGRAMVLGRPQVDTANIDHEPTPFFDEPSGEERQRIDEPTATEPLESVVHDDDSAITTLRDVEQKAAPAPPSPQSRNIPLDRTVMLPVEEPPQHGGRMVPPTAPMQMVPVAPISGSMPSAPGYPMAAMPPSASGSYAAQPAPPTWPQSSSSSRGMVTAQSWQHALEPRPGGGRKVLIVFVVALAAAAAVAAAIMMSGPSGGAAGEKLEPASAPSQAVAPLGDSSPTVAAPTVPAEAAPAASTSASASAAPKTPPPYRPPSWYKPGKQGPHKPPPPRKTDPRFDRR
jgi:eukaryotic-like serine/threonine-protein kinase